MQYILTFSRYGKKKDSARISLREKSGIIEKGKRRMKRSGYDAVHGMIPFSG
jgi:hypothetical protein